MEAEKNLVIDLADFKNGKSSNYTGRPQGVEARKKMGLDDLDKDQKTKISFKIPAGTTSFNPSFYLGLLFKSYKALGLDGFKSKYHFILESDDLETQAVLTSNLDDGMRNAINALKHRNILQEFINS